MELYPNLEIFKQRLLSGETSATEPNAKIKATQKTSIAHAQLRVRLVAVGVE